MAHEIEIIDGQAQMAYAGEVPWHGLGTQVSSDLSPHEMMVAAGLDWQVVKKPIQYGNSNEKKTVIDNKAALVRETDNQLLSIVGNNWHPIQNEDAFSMFNEMCQAGDMEMNTAGSLKDGQIVWGLAKVKKSFALKTDQGEDVVDSYLLFSNPHEFGKCADVRFSPIRVVCNNTLTAALSNGKSSVRITHRTAFDPEHTKRLLGIADMKLETYQEAAEFLVSKRYDPDTLIEYFNKVFPVSNQAKTLKVADSIIDRLSYTARKAVNVMEEQPGAELGAGSWWQAFNAVTYLTDHQLGRTADARLQSAWYGPNNALKANALKFATEFANAS
jgi:phage/plasmid-like protein (TIGR03299 family)